MTFRDRIKTAIKILLGQLEPADFGTAYEKSAKDEQLRSLCSSIPIDRLDFPLETRSALIFGGYTVLGQLYGAQWSRRGSALDRETIQHVQQFKREFNINI